MKINTNKIERLTIQLTPRWIDGLLIIYNLVSLQNVTLTIMCSCRGLWMDCIPYIPRLYSDVLWLD